MVEVEVDVEHVKSQLLANHLSVALSKASVAYLGKKGNDISTALFISFVTIYPPHKRSAKTSKKCPFLPGMAEKGR